MIITNIKNKIVREYLEKKCSQMFLERKYKVSRDTIRKLLVKSGIKEHWFKNKYLNHKDIIKRYLNQKKSVLEIAKELEVGRRPIENILKKHKIKKRNNREALIGKFSKEKNPNWKGGITSYGKIRNTIPRYSSKIREWRNGVRKKCGKFCYLCLKEKKVDAHHIISVREIIREKLDIELVFNIDNGITICRKCHQRIHFKEKQYREHFLQMIKLRELREEPKK